MGYVRQRLSRFRLAGHLCGGRGCLLHGALRRTHEAMGAKRFPRPSKGLRGLLCPRASTGFHSRPSKAFQSLRRPCKGPQGRQGASKGIQGCPQASKAFPQVWSASCGPSQKLGQESSRDLPRLQRGASKPLPKSRGVRLIACQTIGRRFGSRRRYPEARSMDSSWARRETALGCFFARSIGAARGGPQAGSGVSTEAGATEI